MKDFKKELREKIESGEYFAEAKDWYLNTYITRFIERSYSIILIILVGYLLNMTWDYYNEIQPIKKNLPIRVEISDAAEEYTKITYLGNKSKNFNINKVLIRYFSARFVEAIETYDYRDNFKLLTKNANVISKLGTQALQNYYQDKTSIRNSDSMVLKYRRNVIREVSVDKDKIEIAPLEDNGDFYNKKYLVTVNYAVREIYKQERAEVTYWQAKLKLNFETIHYNFEEGDFNDLNFRVYEYETNKVK